MFCIPQSVLKAICLPILKRCFRFEIQGLEHLQKTKGAVILAGNHTGLLDGAMVLSALERPFLFLMTEEVFGWGLVGKVMPFLNMIPIYKQKTRQALKQTVQCLEDGRSICIFPEGRLTVDGQLGALHSGVAYLQEKSGVPVIPFAIQGGFQAWPVDQVWPVFCPVKLCFGEPIYRKSGQSRSGFLEELRQAVLVLAENSNQEVMSPMLN